MNESLLVNWFDDIYNENNTSGQRAAIILSGEFSFFCNAIKIFFDKQSYDSVLWISSRVSQGVLTKKSTIFLGEEHDCVVFDAYSDFDLDSFGAISGTIKACGILFVIIPELDSQQNYINNSRFLKRALSNIKKYTNIFLVSKARPLPKIEKFRNIVESLDNIDYPYRTTDQKLAVEAICRNVIEKDKFVMVLTSDRGRGKSASLGLAAGLLMKNTANKIIVTAPRKSISDTVFFYARQASNTDEPLSGKLICSDSSLEFMAPDDLIDTVPSADVILVDEASAIPLPMLEKILDLYPVIVFATTIHGYEGTGRGFALKFNKTMDFKAPGWSKFEMHTPIRWIKNDPVEKWVDHMLCMDADIESIEELKNLDENNCTINCIDREELLADDSKLLSIFALLVYAHYRTKPSDLAFILDNESVRIYTLEFQNKILAVSLVSEEGGFSKELSMDVYEGKRRPRGHLLAQTLCFHAGVESAAMLKYARIMRIAVHPEKQRQGLGSFLLKEIVLREKNSGMDAIGCSFGATYELMRFWSRLEFETVRMGFTRDHVSGTHSAVMLKSLNSKSENVFLTSRIKFKSYIKDWLTEPLSNLSSDMKQYIEAESLNGLTQWSEYEWKDVESFAFTHRGYEACMSPLLKLLTQYNDLLCHLDTRLQKIVDDKIYNAMPWSEVVKNSGLTGKSQAIELLKDAVKLLLKNIESSGRRPLLLG